MGMKPRNNTTPHQRAAKAIEKIDVEKQHYGLWGVPSDKDAQAAAILVGAAAALSYKACVDPLYLMHLLVAEYKRKEGR